MKVQDFLNRLNALAEQQPRTLQNEMVIQIKQLGDAIGPHHAVPVVGLHNGFDWDSGRLFVVAERELRPVDEAFEAEKKRSRDRGEALAFLWMTMSNKDMDHKQKVRVAKQQLKRFGYTFRDEGEEE